MFSRLAVETERRKASFSSFVKELLQLKFDSEIVMASFDVTSLFTNIPLDETIEITAQQLFSIIPKFFMVFREPNLSNF